MGEGAVEGLDEAGRRELAHLQDLAYGPDAEGPLPAQAAARLAELEAAALGGAAAAEPAIASAAPSSVDPPAGSLLPSTHHSFEAARKEGVARPSSESSIGRVRGLRDRTRVIAVAVVAVMGLVLAGVAAARTAAELAPVPVARLAAEPVASGAGSTAPPQFPIAEDMQWSAPLGTVLGWDVWVGRSRSNFACLAVIRSLTVRADCVSAGDFSQSGVSIYLPPGSIAADLRPPELVGTAAVAYRWTTDRAVTVQVDR